jgi:pSer/pThr/pTyr-binding forkhead associated (FHA) protein
MFRFYLESLVEADASCGASQSTRCRSGSGGSPGLSLSLASDSVSKEHAEIVMRDDALYVVDLGSKNGTFVNSERVDEAPLHEGDILHFAQVEFRVGSQEIDETEDLGLEPRRCRCAT